ncbi:hypothetical protein PR202_ga19568 [Eleusine coracana subsp. coracana]|uniref:(+)-neomenthol dehydrogenase n=1 Tax=Eleusine coracana subsp. coracana TaxID=191504 RepID=A0AAV5CUW1_ELECO|nr:hypothetical protein PR202_ga19568 [Eleusine coracana subsp. coracana]
MDQKTAKQKRLGFRDITNILQSASNEEVPVKKKAIEEQVEARRRRDRANYAEKNPLTFRKRKDNQPCDVEQVCNKENVEPNASVDWLHKNDNYTVNRHSGAESDIIGTPEIGSEEGSRIELIAVVTGGNKGIGLEVCKQLGYNGLKVILTARDEERGSAAVEMLHESGLPSVQFHRLDVSDPSSAARLAEFIKEKFGRLDILINNAGVIGATAEIDTTTPLQEVAPGGVLFREERAFVQLHFNNVEFMLCSRSCNTCAHELARYDKDLTRIMSEIHSSFLFFFSFCSLDLKWLSKLFKSMPSKQLLGKSPMERLHWLLQHSSESYEEAEECLKINYFGTKYVTEALLPLLQSSSDGRLINVSSNYGLLRVSFSELLYIIRVISGIARVLLPANPSKCCSVLLIQYFSGENLKQELNDIDNLTVERLDEMSELFLNDYRNGQLKSHGWPADSEYLAYKVSKALVNGYTRILAKRYSKLCVNSVHPGYCKTDINFDTGEYTAEEGASSIVTVALLTKEGPTGAFFYRNENVSFV